ncbi:Arm DNA-binding domain-containing protein [Shewanella mangrovisoli]|uniref:Arm DNA-binding domain-containing protein n=1 Tax=Shewanella mangrovisoli TaxID=2864211 RepID=UPI0035B8219B
MASATLTEREIKGAKPKASKYELTDSTRERGAGRLVVRVSTTGSKEFAFKYQIDGKRQYIALGRYPSLSLTEARDKTKPLAGMIKEGIDPKAELAKEKARRC